jgi:predicted RND superfamily exporter protein
MEAMMEHQNSSLIERFYKKIVLFPKTVILASLILFVVTISFLPKLVKDTRSDAFLAADNPALLYRDKVKEQFGLSDPMVVAIVNHSDRGIYTPESMRLISLLTNAFQGLPNIDAERVFSLATESNIEATDDGMLVEAFFEELPQTQAQMDHLQSAIKEFPLYHGNLVSTDGKATIIAMEVLDETKVEQTYKNLQALVALEEKSEQIELHIAGEGAIAGYLGSYIDSDAQRLNPIAGLIITLIIIFAFRRLSPGLLGNFIIAASVLMTLSIMAANGTPYFVITNAMPVILIGISVADAIHIFSHYFDLQLKQPEYDKKALIVETMVDMWRPITLTTITTAAGFLGLYFASYMPPFKYFGLYTALGVSIAWLYSMVFLPAMMALIKPRVSESFKKAASKDKTDFFSRMMLVLGRLSLKKPNLTILLFASIAFIGAYSALQIKVDENRIGTFHPSEEIVKADKAINTYLNGSSNLNIVIETQNNEDLFLPENLKKIEALQVFAETLPHVTDSVSIVDYLKQMNRSLNGGDVSEYRLPQDKDLIAQYFLIYSASGDPTDFEEEVDYDYRVANIRVTMNDGHFQETKPVVEALDAYIQNEFNDSGITANLSGRINLNYHWIKDLGASHFTGLALSLGLVWLVSALLFKSPLAGLFALIPVLSSILLVYASMMFMGISLGIGTSMFASVAIGLGVDFAIHTIDRLKTLFRLNEGNMDKTLMALYPTTGRALLFNFLAIACGFGVLISSKVVPLNNFGTIVVLAVTMSFLASVTLLPALIKVFRPRFITSESSSNKSLELSVKHLVVTLIVFTMGAAVLTINTTRASELPSGDRIIQTINQQKDGESVFQRLKMTLIDKRGKERVRETIGYRKYFGEEKRTILFYSAPSNVKGTSFLTYDYPDKSTDDDQWLYLPALRKVRRISASDRGDYFLGTDFTYDDIKNERKVDIEDYNFKTLKEDEVDEQKNYLVEAIPRNESIAKELGYGRLLLWVRSDIWMITSIEYSDLKGNPLKTFKAEDIRQIDGIWTRHKLSVSNHKTGHTSIFTVSDVRYDSRIKDSLFTERSMKKGP